MPEDLNHITTLYRPVGPQELGLIAASGYREFPPRLPEQPIFYPVLDENYAHQLAREWNAKDSGVGYVTRFAVRSDLSPATRCKRWAHRSTENYGFPPRN